MKLLVIGNPIIHSMSPLIHNYWLKTYKLAYKYEKKKVSIEELVNLILLMKKKKILGLNITIPYKIEIIKNLDYIDDIASKAGAVNTVYIKNDKIVGTNTDGIGLVNSIKIDAQFKLKKKNILIIGSGGAARGIVYQLVDEKISSITLKNRNDVKAQELCKEVIQKTNFENIEIEFWKERKLKSKFDLVINTTSVGMKKDEKLLFDFSDLKDSSLICDIIYNPRETFFLAEAKKRNLSTLNGVGMLIRQAQESFFKWFKIKVKEKEILEIKKILEQYLA